MCNPHMHTHKFMLVTHSYVWTYITPTCIHIYELMHGIHMNVCIIHTHVHMWTCASDSHFYTHELIVYVTLTCVNMNVLAHTVHTSLTHANMYHCMKTHTYPLIWIWTHSHLLAHMYTHVQIASALMCIHMLYTNACSLVCACMFNTHTHTP